VEASTITSPFNSKNILTYIVFANGNHLATQNPASTPTVPEFSLWTIPLLLSAMLSTSGLLFYHKNTSEALCSSISVFCLKSTAARIAAIVSLFWAIKSL
jgi:hypothetical protein